MTVLSLTPSVALTSRDLVSGWLLGFQSHNTRDAYRRDVAQFTVFLEASGITDPLEANRVLVDGWSRSLELRGLRPASVARKLASLASFYQWCEEQNLLDRNPVARVRRPRVSSHPSTGLDRDELRAFLSAAEVSGPRDHCLALLLALSGLRVTSALGINVGDLSSERGHRTVKVRGKGLKEQLVPLAAPVAEAVDRLLGVESSVEAKSSDVPLVAPGNCGGSPLGREALDEIPSASADVDYGRAPVPLFTTSTGQRLTRFDAYRIVRRLATQAGISKPVSPHSLRSSYCQIALDAGAGLHDVQASMAHSDPKTTIGYLHRMGNLDRNPTYLVSKVVAE
jgi:integrase/recombinase XerD